jgi:hypothetical protein
MSGRRRSSTPLWLALVTLCAGCGGNAAFDPLAPIPVRVAPTEVEPVALRQHWTVRFELDVDDDDEPDAPSHGPALGSDAVFIAYTSQMLARDRDNGNLLWQLRLASEIALAPIAIDDGVVIATEDHWLWIDALGRTKAALDLVATPLDTTTIGRRIYVTDSEGVYALRLNDESAVATITEVWQTELEGARVLTASLPDERLFVISTHGRVHALAVRDGRVLWTSDSVEAGGPRPATIAGTLFVVANDFRVVALNADDGKRRWRSKEIGVRITGAPAANGDLVWVPGLDAALHGYATAGGSHQHRVALAGRVYVDLAVWGRWVIASPQAGPWTLLRGPLRRNGPADPGLPRVLPLSAESDLSLPPGVGPGGVAVVETNGTVRLFTPHRGIESPSEEH